MRVLLIHNRYRTSAPSGEDAAVRNEQRMLERQGVEVVCFDRCNDDIDDSTLLSKASAAADTIWSRRARAELSKVLRSVRPNVAHVHNTFSMLSPSIYGACQAEGVPVVQTLHNFRLFCPGALFLRDGKPCEDCVDKSLLESVRHRCYRGSFAATATLASMLTLHRALGTYSRHIDRYIALTEFARSKVIKAGVPARSVVVKPNFVPDPPSAGDGSGDYVVFVGRLFEGKGAATLLDAWRQLPEVKLKIVGDGGLRAALQSMAQLEQLNVEFLGAQNRAVVLDLIAKAKILIIPSEWYEGFPMVIAEAFACGTPVLASKIGSLEELVAEGIRGRQFAAGNSLQLAAGVRRILGDGAALRRMRINARTFFEQHLTEQGNYASLMSIYSAVIDNAPRHERRRQI
jgi:glycosyltransferase involved in cell wall biosynthesis